MRIHDNFADFLHGKKQEEDAPDISESVKNPELDALIIKLQRLSEQKNIDTQEYDALYKEVANAVKDDSKAKKIMAEYCGH